MEKLNIKLLLNSIAESYSPVLDEGQYDSSLRTDLGDGTENLEEYDLATLLPQWTGNDDIDVIMNAIIAAAIAAGIGRQIQCFKAIKKMTQKGGEFYKKLANIQRKYPERMRDLGEKLAYIREKEDMFRALDEAVKELFRIGGCSLTLKAMKLYYKHLGQNAKNILTNASARVGSWIAEGFEGVRTWDEVVGVSIAATNSSLLASYTAYLAFQSSALTAQCTGLSAGEAAALVVGGVVVILTTVLVGEEVGGAVGIAARGLAAKLLAGGGALAACQTLSADQLAEVAIDAAALRRRFLEEANAPDEEEEYIDNVLDPSGLSDVSDYPGNSGG